VVERGEEGSGGERGKRGREGKEEGERAGSAPELMLGSAELFFSVGAEQEAPLPRRAQRVRRAYGVILYAISLEKIC